MVGKGQSKWMFQVVWLFGEGVPLPSQPSRVLAHSPIGALHAGGVDGPTDRRRLERRFSLGDGPVDHTGGDGHDPTVRPLCDHDGRAHVGRWTAAGVRETTARPLTRGCRPYALYVQQGFGIVGHDSTGHEGERASGR